VREGDGRTPEGRFRVSGRIPKSQFYKAFLLSYPEVEDAERGLRDGIVSASQAEAIRLAHEEGRPPPHDTPLGGLVEIHGSGSGSDWTLGCVAMDDEAIDELWGIVRVGTWVEIRP
jgi:murein L,D-transpeptidase YafK